MVSELPNDRIESSDFSKDNVEELVNLEMSVSKVLDFLKRVGSIDSEKLPPLVIHLTAVSDAAMAVKVLGNYETLPAKYKDVIRLTLEVGTEKNLHHLGESALPFEDDMDDEFISSIDLEHMILSLQDKMADKENLN